MNATTPTLMMRLAAASVLLPLALTVTSGSEAATYYFHTDHLSTPQVVTDASGDVAWKGRYDPFGNATETVADVEQNLRFPGQYLDRETGLHQNRFRDYDPGIGRYIESDPIGLSGGFNTYAYVGGSPFIFSDPLGLERKPGRTPPSRWPGLPTNLGGKKPKWNSEGYWEGVRGKKLTWDDRSHGTGIDRGEGPQAGHWDVEEENNRYDENGEPLPGSDDYSEFSCDSSACSAATDVVIAGGIAYIAYRCARMAPSMFPPLWWTIPGNVAIP